MGKKPQFSLNTKDPQVRDMIIREYNQYGENYIKRRYGIDRSDISRWKDLKNLWGSLEPRYYESGRTPSLTKQEEKKLIKALLDDPFMTNAELAAKVGNKISARGAGNYVSRSAMGFTTKMEETDVEKSFDAEVVKENKEFLKQVHNIPYDKRIYVDETWISAGIRRRKGRFPKGVSYTAPREKRYPRHTVIGAITNNGWLFPSTIVKQGSIDTEDFENWVKDELAPHIKKGDKVFWDRHGKSGRAKKPVALHFSPKAKRYLTQKGAELIMLPRYGKYSDPIELLWGDTKRAYEKRLAALFKKSCPQK
jgi:transposase